MRIILPVLIWFCITTILTNCANPLSPTGGPRDTIPPYLISSNPESQTLNFNDRVIRMEFSEFISTDQLQSNLTITPNQDIKYTQLAKRNQLTLKLDQDLKDSTTYIFNFFNGVTDITEKNPVENLVIPFSTGPYIDSISISGNLKTLWDQQVAEEVTIGLYLISDSLNYTDTKPTYFIKSDEFGQFQLTNLKVDQYTLLAFTDVNNNLIFDPKEESHASYVDTIFLESNLDSLDLQLVKINPYPPKKLSARPLSSYFQIRYDRDITSYKLIPADTTITLFSKIEEEKESIRIYPFQFNIDSLQTIVEVRDSLRNLTIDTVFVKFNESNRKPTEFSYSFPSKPLTTTTDTLKFSATFNKPISAFTKDSITINADTIYKAPISPDIIDVNFDYSRTMVTISIPLVWTTYEDTVKSIISNTVPDSLVNIDQLNINTISLNLPGAMFSSVEGDTTATKSVLFQRKPQPQGILSYDLLINRPSFIVQLIDKNYNTIRETKSKKSGSYTALQAGTYSIRVLVDSNGDGQWQNTNFLQSQQHEPVFVYPQFTELRDNWEINIGSGPINTGY